MGSNGSKGKKKDFTKLTEVIYYNRIVECICKNLIFILRKKLLYYQQIHRIIEMKFLDGMRDFQ